MRQHIAIVGGGLMGASAAWHLARRGNQVTLFEQFAPGHDRGSSHGSSRIFRIGYPDELYAGLALRALPLWRELEDETSTQILTITGGLDHGPQAVTRQVFDTIRALGRPAEMLEPADVQRRWPSMRADTSAVFHPDGGRLHADNAVAALWQAAEARGAELHANARVERIRVGDGRVEVVAANQPTLVADSVVVAVGGWAPRQLRSLIDGLPELRVTKEQPVHFPAPDALDWPSFIHHRSLGLPAAFSGYGLGSVDGVKVGLHGVGPVIDADTADRDIDEQAVKRVQEYAAQWLPGLDLSQPSPIACLYTTTPTEDFVIDRQGPVIVLAGFSGHGFKFGSVIGELAADLADGQLGIARFALGRAS